MTKDTGGPAFPESLDGKGPFGGMTLLDYFAGQAVLSAPDYQRTCDPALTAKWAYEVAAAMLVEKHNRE